MPTQTTKQSKAGAVRAALAAGLTDNQEIIAHCRALGFPVTTQYISNIKSERLGKERPRMGGNGNGPVNRIKKFLTPSKAAAKTAGPSKRIGHLTVEEAIRGHLPALRELMALLG